MQEYKNQICCEICNKVVKTEIFQKGASTIRPYRIFCNACYKLIEKKLKFLEKIFEYANQKVN